LRRPAPSHTSPFFVEGGTAAASPTALSSRASPGDRRIRLVDLGHLASGNPRRLWIVADEIRVVLPSEAAPRGLDFRGQSAGFDAENIVGIASGHGLSVVPAWTGHA
jgi:hypothetical protein